MNISVLTKAEAYEDIDAIAGGVLLALHEMSEAAGVLGASQDLQDLADSLNSLHVNASLAAKGSAH